ncbi:unnamed protein product [Moneuplotes crassus]|uniref:Uncharacterized protein n=1 Tax=Euplotes crassus TaxID=5936 RepID=A0AAD1X5P5_EUPCR|nr:unnamed protein product [Moneuplotes crassus]
MDPQEEDIVNLDEDSPHAGISDNLNNMRINNNNNEENTKNEEDKEQAERMVPLDNNSYPDINHNDSDEDQAIGSDKGNREDRKEPHNNQNDEFDFHPVNNLNSDIFDNRNEDEDWNNMWTTPVNGDSSPNNNSFNKAEVGSDNDYAEDEFKEEDRWDYAHNNGGGWDAFGNNGIQYPQISINDGPPAYYQSIHNRWNKDSDSSSNKGDDEDGFNWNNNDEEDIPSIWNKPKVEITAKRTYKPLKYPKKTVYVDDDSEEEKIVT